MPTSKIPIAILGATGAVGQRMIQLLVGHPWFEIAALTGSERTIGRPYGELVRWVLDDAPPPDVARMIVRPSEDVADVALALSALPTDVAREIEPLWAAHTAVCSNASTYRMAADVPLIIPEVNPEHLAMIEQARLASDALVLRAAEAKDASAATPGDAELRAKADLLAAQAKLFTSNAAWDAADRAVQVLGGRGWSTLYRPGRHLQDVRVCRIYEGTDEILKLKVAAAVLGGKEYEAFK